LKTIDIPPTILLRAKNRWVPHTPDFLWSFVDSANFMRLSLTKGAHVAVSRAAYRKFGVSRVLCEMWVGCLLSAKSEASGFHSSSICRSNGGDCIESS
jgi:hypothetical protein